MFNRGKAKLNHRNVSTPQFFTNMANPFLMAGLQIAQGAVNNWLGEMRENRAVQRDYYLSERAADKAAQRQGEMYERFFSPEALMRQYEAAGLSPGLMMGGAPGSSMGGSSAPQGGAAMQPSTFMPIDVLGQIAQLENIKAITKKTEAETKNIETETTLKDLEVAYNEMRNKKENIDFKILTSQWKNRETGKATSLFEMADNCFTYESFLEDVRENEGKIDPTIYNLTKTEQGQRVLREIYENASRFHRDIITLSEEAVNASFQLSIIEALNKQSFAAKNAEAAIQELQTSIDSNKLTSEQKTAWENLLDRLGKKGSTTRDIIVVLGMIVNRFAGKVNFKVPSK